MISPNPWLVGRWLATAMVAACAFLRATPDAAEAIILVPGKTIERELSGGQAHAYRLALAAGEYAGVTVEQLGINVVVEVLDAGGNVIAEFDSESRKQGQEFVGLSAGSPVNYELRVKARYTKDPPGRYQVRIAELRQGTEQDGAAFETHKLGTQALQLEYAGKFDEALQVTERAIALGEKALGPEDAYVGHLLFRRGSEKRIRGDHVQAEQILQRAIAVDQKALGREDPQTALALRELGQLYMEMNQYAKAEPLFEEQLHIYERTLGSEHPSAAMGLRLTAILHHHRGDLARARDELQRAVAIAEKTLDQDDNAFIGLVHDLGTIYNAMGDTERAEPWLERALAMVEQKYGRESYFLAAPLMNIGKIALHRKQYTRALELYWRAEALNEKALGSGNSQTASVLMAIADVYGSEGEYAKALELHQRVLETLMTAVNPYDRLTLMALGNVARTHAAQGNSVRAIEYQTRHEDALEKNIALNLAIGSEREKLAYLSSISESTDRTISLHAREASNDGAARDLAALVLLQRKGRVLDAMSGSVAALRERLNTEDRKLFDDLAEINTKLARLALGGRGKTPVGEYQKQLAALEQERERLEAGISRRSAEFRAQSQPVTLAAMRAAIPSDGALIELAVYRRFDPKGENPDQAYERTRYIAYVVRQRGEIQWRDLGPAEETDDAVAALRQALRDARRKDVQELARAIDQKIMQPIRALVGDAKQLLISPDGQLNLIPFEALVDEQGHYLLELYSINYLTAGRDLLRMQVARSSKSAPVVLANPLFGEPQTAQMARAERPKTNAFTRRRSITTGEDLSSVYFAPLAGTAEEARGIKSLFPEAEVLTGRQATKAALKRVDAPSILHIATHGFFLEDAAGDATESAGKPSGTRAIHANLKIENPLLRSGLALAGANLNTSGGNDGVLTALEASNLNLWGTKVVTLSACETGVGEVKSGEGVYGLRRAFFLAGAETLVMSLWPVSDRVTREIMTAYYTGLKKGLGRGEALRQAQLAMLKRKDRQHPFYWASFIQSGDWKNLDGK